MPLVLGLKICSASKPQEAYGLAKSMIRDNGPGVLLLPVKLMKTRGPCQVRRVGVTTYHSRLFCSHQNTDRGPYAKWFV
jgi:pyruvate/2-oxoglutarate/acetoin dehydrogenase E1 component